MNWPLYVGVGFLIALVGLLAYSVMDSVQYSNCRHACAWRAGTYDVLSRLNVDTRVCKCRWHEATGTQSAEFVLE